MRIVVYFLLIAWPLQLLSQGIRNQFISLQQDFHDHGIDLLDKNLVNFDSTLTQTTRIGFNKYLGRKSFISVGASKGQMWTPNLENKFASKINTLGFDATLVLKTRALRINVRKPFLSPNFSFGYHYWHSSKIEESSRIPNYYALRYAIGLEMALKNNTSVFVWSAINQQLNGSFETHAVHSIGVSRGVQVSKSKVPIETKQGSIKQEEKTVSDSGTDRNDLESKGLVPKNQVIIDSRIDSLGNVIQVLTERQQKLRSEILQLSKWLKAKENKPKHTLIEPTNKEDIRSDISDSSTVYIQKPIEMVYHKTQSYYVVILSVTNLNLAMAEAQKIRSNYPNVRILADPSGYYRTAIFAGSDKQIAKNIQSDLIKEGFLQAWLAFY